MPALLTLAFTAAVAGPLPDVERLPPAWILVDRGAWLYERPRDDAPRLRVTSLDAAPEHRASPVVILERTARVGDFLRVRTGTHAHELQPDGDLGSPDRAPEGWPHCYPQAEPVAQLAVDAWVRVDDVRPVLTREVRVELDDGAAVTLGPGLALAPGAEGTWRVAAHHLTVLAAVPAEAVGHALPLDLQPPITPTLVAVGPAGSYVVHPTWRARVDVRGRTLELQAPLDADGPGIHVVRDRCVSVTLPSPLHGVPRHDPSALRGAPAWPVQVPEGTRLTDGSGVERGVVAGGPYVLWSTSGCAWSEQRGMCCDPPPGLERAGGSPALCFDADLPTRTQDRSLASIMQHRTSGLARRSVEAVQVRPGLTWRLSDLRGGLAGEGGSEPFLLALEAERERLTYCYARALQQRPDLSGTLEVRVAVAPDARARAPQRTGGSLDEGALVACVNHRLEALLVPEQLGRVASVVDLTLDFTPLPVEGR